MHGSVLLDVVAHRHTNDDTDNSQDDEKQDEANPAFATRRACVLDSNFSLVRSVANNLVSTEP